MKKSLEQHSSLKLVPTLPQRTASIAAAFSQEVEVSNHELSKGLKNTFIMEMNKQV